MTAFRTKGWREKGEGGITVTKLLTLQGDFVTQLDEPVVCDLRLKKDVVFAIDSAHARRSRQCFLQAKHCWKAADFGAQEILGSGSRVGCRRKQSRRSEGNGSRDK